MKSKFVAKLYLEKDECENKAGDDADELYTWMLAQAQGMLGDVHGEVIDSETKKIVKQFRKAPPD